MRERGKGRERERKRKEREGSREGSLFGRALKSYGSLNESLTKIPENGPVRFQYQKWKWKWIRKWKAPGKWRCWPKAAVVATWGASLLMPHWSPAYLPFPCSFPLFAPSVRQVAARLPASVRCLGHRRLVIVRALYTPPFSPHPAGKIYMSMMLSLQRSAALRCAVCSYPLALI